MNDAERHARSAARWARVAVACAVVVAVLTIANAIWGKA